MSATDPAILEERVLDALREVLDPEVGLNVVDLGLVYGLWINGIDVRVNLTMTTPACPLGDQILHDAETRIAAIDGVGNVRVELVWYPAWGPERMSPSARKTLGWGK